MRALWLSGRARVGPRKRLGLAGDRFRSTTRREIVAQTEAVEYDESAQVLHHRRNLLGQSGRSLGNALAHDRQLLFERRVLDPLVETSSLERVVNFTCAIRGQDYQWWFGRPHRAEFRNRDLKLRQQFEQVPFELFVRTVDFVDEQHGRSRPGRVNCLQQRTFDEERFAVEFAPRL